MGSTVSKSEVCGVGVSRPIIHPAKWTERLDRIQEKRRTTGGYTILQNAATKGTKTTNRMDR